MKLTSLDDVGQLITVDWLREKIRFFDLIEKTYLSSTLLCVFSLIAICTYIDPNLETLAFVVPAVFALVAFILFLVAELCAFRWGFNSVDLLAMPQSDCRIILEAIEKYEECHFLKERLANMERKLTILESNFIKGQLRFIEAKLDEQACRSLYGVQP